MAVQEDIRARMERLGRPLKEMVPARRSEAPRVLVKLRRAGPYADRVSVFKRLFNEDATARDAKNAIDSLANHDEATCLIPSDTDMEALARDLAVLDVEVVL